MTTLRKHLEAIIHEIEEEIRLDSPMNSVAEDWYRKLIAHASDSLEILNQAERLDLYYGEPEANTWAVVPDPGPA